MTNAVSAEEPQLSSSKLLTAKELADLVSVNHKRVYELSIPAVRISERGLRWRLVDVLTWIDERREKR